MASIGHGEVDGGIIESKADQRAHERGSREREAARKCAAVEARQELAERTAQLRSRG